MKKHILLAVTASFLVAGSGFVACSSNNTTSNNNPGDAGTGDTGVNQGDDTGVTPTPDSGPDTGVDSGPVNPAPPTLGAQIDRMGRPAINTALNHAFDGNTATSGPAKDAYNADTSASAYSPQFEGNLAILDSLNTGASVDGGGGCGDQPYYNAAIDGGGAYGTLAGVLANDMLWLNTTAAACTTGYLAVELNATNVVVNSDCGGRTLTYDTIQTTYSIVSGVGLTGFSSGVTATPATKTPTTTFPYFHGPI